MSEKLSKLILMLSSDQDGEVVAAARAIDRQLTTMGKDWHWLVAAIKLPSSTEHATDAYTYATAATNKDGGYVTEADRQAILGLHDILSELSDNEKEFISSIYRRHRVYAGSTFITKRQRQWLHDIYGKHT